MPNSKSYPMVGVSYNPRFTKRQLARFAKNKANHAAWLHSCASEAFGSAAEWTSDQHRRALKFDYLEQTTSGLVALYRSTCGDGRVDRAAIGDHVNALFWEFLGAPDELLRLEEEDHYLKAWDSSLRRSACFVRLLTDIALAGSASGDELEAMAEALVRLRARAAKVTSWHMSLILLDEKPAHVDTETAGLGIEAAALTTLLSRAIVDVHSRLEREAPEKEAA